MAELLVRVVDKVNEDFYLNCQCTKRGDVIVVQPDGWGWGLEELKNPDWRIIVMPELSLAEAEAMLAPELPVDPLNPSKTLQRRAFKFDLSTLEKSSNEAKDYLLDATRAAPAIKFVEAVEDVGKADVPIVVDVVKDADGKPVLDENAKPTPIVEVKEITASHVTVDELLATKVEKEPIKDPAVLGDEIAVIG